MHTCTRNDGLAVHGQEDPRDDEVYPEQEHQADQGPGRLAVKVLPKVIAMMIGTTVITSVKTTVTTTKGTPVTRECHVITKLIGLNNNARSKHLKPLYN